MLALSELGSSDESRGPWVMGDDCPSAHLAAVAKNAVA